MAISLGDLTKISLGVTDDKRIKQEYTEIARDGIYYTYNNGAMSITQKQHSIPEGVLKGSLVATIEESFKFEERIPFHVFLQIIQFYHDVVRQNGTEASVLVYRNVNDVEIPQEFKDEFGEALMEVGKFVVLVPNQINTRSHTQFANFNGAEDESVHTWCERNLVGVLETHSHCDFSAFWSGEDDKHEKHSKLRAFMVIGNNTKDVMLKKRYSYNYKYFDDIDFHEIFTETGVVEEVKVSHNIITKGLERFIQFIKGNKPEEVTQRDLDWKEVITSLDLDNSPVNYPKEAWFARIKKGSFYGKGTNATSRVIDGLLYLNDESDYDRYDSEGYWDDEYTDEDMDESLDEYSDEDMDESLDEGLDEDMDEGLDEGLDEVLDEGLDLLPVKLYGGYGDYGPYNNGKKRHNYKQRYGRKR